MSIFSRSEGAPKTTRTPEDTQPSPQAETPRPDGRPAAGAPGERKTTGPRVALKRLDAFYGETKAVKEVELTFEPNTVTALIGPSGCGKSTLVRCINRMHEEIPHARAEGEVLLEDRDLYGDDVDVVAVRRAVGMVFQKPNPFPTMSIFDNVAAGLRLTGGRGHDLRARVERSLRGAGLWEEVKDRLDTPGVGLSGGQQQRLCIARTIATRPEVILLDEPTSALDPISTLKVEELIDELKRDFTIAIVTHNMQQAARCADQVAFFYLGEMIEVAPAAQLFTSPKQQRTREYITGRFG